MLELYFASRYHALLLGVPCYIQVHALLLCDQIHVCLTLPMVVVELSTMACMCPPRLGYISTEAPDGNIAVNQTM